MTQNPYPNRVKEIRKDQAKITQKELAERLRSRGFRATASYISQIEAGKKNLPYNLAVAICEELGLEINRVTYIFNRNT